MSIRKNTYDFLDRTIAQFQSVLWKTNDTLEKSEQLSVPGSLEAAMEGYKVQAELCKSLYQQFNDLRDDYKAGRITLVPYRNNLQKFRDLLKNSGEKLTTKELHAAEIAAEIKKHFTN